MTWRSLALVCAACMPGLLLADFSYDEVSKMTGGSLYTLTRMAGPFAGKAREPQKSTVAVKGSRMVHIYADRASITDVDKETITEIYFQKKTYSVITFAEMTQAMQEMMKRMGDQKAEAEPQFKIKVESTGKTRTINGLDTQEQIMTMESEMTDPKSGAKITTTIKADMWMAPKVPGYDEVIDLQKKMGQKLAFQPGMGTFAGRGDVARGMAAVMREGAKLAGLPVLKVVSIGGLGPAGMPEGGAPQSSAPARERENVEKPSTGSVIGGAIGSRVPGLGGLGGFGRRKKQQQEAPAEEKKEKEEKTEAAPPPPAAAPSAGVLMEMTSEMSNFSSASLDPAKFSVPSGFKEVDNEMKKFLREK